MNHQLVELEEGWAQIEAGAIATLHKILEDDMAGGHKFDNSEYMNYFTLVYNMCTQKPPHNYSEELYRRYKKAISDYLTAKVLPAVRAQAGLNMLKEIGKRWNHHKINVKWMKNFFSYLDRFHTKRQNLPQMREVGMQCFKDVIHESTSADVRTAILDLIQQEREGQQVDHTLLKGVVEIFVEMSMSQELEVYITDFESQFLEDTSAFYAREAQRWLQQDGLPDYLIKAEQHLKLETDRVSNYLHGSTEEKLLKVINKELLEVHQTALMQKDATGLEALLRDDKKEELARLYRLYVRLPTGLLPPDDDQFGLLAVSKMVKADIERVGTELVQSQVGLSSGGDDFVDQLIALHTKYETLVKECFEDNSLFHKALKEAHEVFMNIDLRGKGEGGGKKSKGNGSSMPELLAAFCDNLLKKGGVKLEEDQIEERLEKLVRTRTVLRDRLPLNCSRRI
eukprot:SAG31_NODE_72_length_27821_cov_26.870572_12_plen_453_part_00